MATSGDFSMATDIQASVEGLGRAVGGGGPVEVGRHVCGPLGQGPAQAAQLGQRGRDAVAQAFDEGAHRGDLHHSKGRHPLAEPDRRFCKQGVRAKGS